MSKQSQVDKFKDLARELECDESEEAFDEALGQIATAPPVPNRDQDESAK